jgi:flagellar biogenesis protein FliO
MKKKVLYLLLAFFSCFLPFSSSFSAESKQQTATPTQAPASHTVPDSSEKTPLETTLPKAQSADDAYEHAFIKMLATLAGLLLLVLLTIWALRKISQGKIGGFGVQKKIKVLERRPLSPKSILYLVEIDHKQVLISESQLEVRALAQTSPYAETDNQ